VELGGLIRGELAEFADMAKRGHHQMPRRIRELVQEHERALAAMNDEPVFIRRLDRAAEDAPGLLIGLLDVLQPPRGPQRLRHLHDTTSATPNTGKTFLLVSGTMRRLLVVMIAALVFAAPAGAALSHADRAAIDRTIDAYIRDGVLGANVPATYDLVTPQFRGGQTRRSWVRGNTPIYPYPARGSSWHGWTIDYVLKNDVAFELVLQPRPGSKGDPTSFNGEVKKVNGRWLIDSFYAAAVFLPKEHRVVGPRDFVPGGGGGGNPGGDSTLGAIWFLLPAAFGALILLVPIAFVVFNLRGSRRRRPGKEERERYEEFWERLRSRAG
jgi:hypothetical protein